MTTTNQHHAHATPDISSSTPPSTTVRDMVSHALAALDQELDRVDQSLKEHQDIPPLLAARLTVFLDHVTNEAKGFANLLSRSQRSQQQRNGNGNHYPHTTNKPRPESRYPHANPATTQR